MVSGDEHIEYLRRALWSRPFQTGASIMVGAGMSLNGVPRLPGAPRFLLWGELLGLLEKRLGYAKVGGRGTSDALRLAQEFESAFGRPALEELLREAVPDDSHEPGSLHSLLVSLPWADVFTTNYDTLLERAVALAPEARYSIVRSDADIPASPRPRIVKLHGSFPSDRPFVITEEDYRIYPRKRAPFVNLVQQAVMETAFCLIGFSGDDPNFLNWTGWVRDSIGPFAPPIYLCGVLELTSSRQHLLRSRHIVPIDLAERFPASRYPDRALRHSLALEWFLLSLQAGEAPDLRTWPMPPPRSLRKPSTGLPPILEPSTRPPDVREPGYESGPLNWKRLAAHLVAWQALRSWYPGWVSLPEANRRDLWSSVVNFVGPREEKEWLTVVNERPPPERLMLWSELAWRSDTVQFPLSTEQARAMAAVLDLVNPYPEYVERRPGDLTPVTPIVPSADWPGPCSLDWESIAKAWVDLAFVVIRSAREEFDDAEFETWCDRIRPLMSLRREWHDRFCYEQAAFWLFRLDVVELDKALAAWKPLESDPFRRAKRAAIGAELRHEPAVLAEVDSALVAVQATGSREPPIRTLSEEGWIVHLTEVLALRATAVASLNDEGQSRAARRRARLDRLAFWFCDPRDHLSERQRSIRIQRLEMLDDSNDPEDTFDPGRFNRTYSFRASAPYSWSIVRTFEAGATCVRTARTKVFEEAISDAARDLFFHGSQHLALSLLLRANAESVIDEVLDRPTIAVLNASFVKDAYSWLSSALRKAAGRVITEEDHQRGDLAARILKPVFNVLSRLCFRLSASQLDDACALFIEMHESRAFRSNRWSLPSELRVFFRRLLDALSHEKIAAWVPAFVKLSVAGTPELPVGGRPDWGEVFSVFPSAALSFKVAPLQDVGWKETIQRLIHLVDTSGPSRSGAVLRLAVLSELGALSASERDEFGRALWDQLDVNGLPSADLAERYLLELPAPEWIGRGRSLKTAILNRHLPTLYEENDGVRGISSKNISIVAGVFESATWASVTCFPEKDTGRRIAWKAAEAHALCWKVIQWMSANLGRAGWGDENLEEVRRAAGDLLLQVILPCLKPSVLRDERVGSALSLTDRRPDGVFAAFGELLSRRAAPELLARRMREAFRHFAPGRDLERIDVARAVLLWCAYSRCNILEAPPGSLVPDLIDSLSGQSPLNLIAGIDLAYALLESFPQELTDRSVEVLERLVGRLSTETRLDAELRDGYEARRRARQHVRVRAAAAGLAGRLCARRERESQQLPSELSEWIAIGASDPLPEVRRAWIKGRTA